MGGEDRGGEGRGGLQVHRAKLESQNQRPGHAGRRICSVYEISSRIRFAFRLPFVFSSFYFIIIYSCFACRILFCFVLSDGSTAGYGLCAVRGVNPERPGPEHTHIYTHIRAGVNVGEETEGRGQRKRDKHVVPGHLASSLADTA